MSTKITKLPDDIEICPTCKGNKKIVKTVYKWEWICPTCGNGCHHQKRYLSADEGIICCLKCGVYL